MKLGLPISAVAFALSFASPAHAALLITGSGAATTLTTSGTKGGAATLYFNGFEGSNSSSVISGLTAKLTLTFTSKSSDGKTFNFGYTMVNTSKSPITASRIPQFGFNVTPDIKKASSTGMYDNINAPGGNVPGIGQVEVCFKDVSQGNCAGGGNGGVTMTNRTAMGTLTLTFASAKSKISLDNFFVRYQSIDGADCVDSAVGRPIKAMAPLPEPSTWLTMLLGFGVVGFSLRRRRQTGTTALRIA